jgi:palmitoyltransferase ZDHHC3/7/25
VGIGNHKYFLLFVFYTFISCVYSLSLVIARFMSCMHRQNHVMSHHMACVDKPTQLVNVLGLVVEGVLFGLFTACMIIDQSSVVTSKVTSIDRLKGDGEDISGSSLSGVVEVFGANKLGGAATKFRSDWLSPFVNVCFPSSLHDEIMGFCRPCMRATALAHGKEDTDERSGGKVVPGSVEIV